MNAKKMEDEEKRGVCIINDNMDVLIEILKRVDDDRSLGVAACVCRLWCSITRNESLWEHLCFPHHLSPPPQSLKPIVLALGGYRRLYMLCVRPLRTRTTHHPLYCGARRQELDLSLSLFCVDYYERVFLAAGGGGGGTLPSAHSSSAPASSLMFLCNRNAAVNI